MTLRIVAGLTSSPEFFANVREPTGWPSAMYCDMSVRSSWRARASSLGPNGADMVERFYSGCAACNRNANDEYGVL
jgi:hypothetical protein